MLHTAAMRRAAVSAASIGSKAASAASRSWHLPSRRFLGNLSWLRETPACAAAAAHITREGWERLPSEEQPTLQESFPEAFLGLDVDVAAALQAAISAPESFDNFLDEEEDPAPQLNEGFWAGYKTVPEMAKAVDRQEIFDIVESFTLTRRAHSRLFQLFKNRILADLASWDAPELAVLCRNFTDLGHLSEDLVVAMAVRVVATAHLCTARELCMLLDACATIRCSVRSIIDTVIVRALTGPEDFLDQELCSLASSLARLGVVDEKLFELIASRLNHTFSSVAADADLAAAEVPQFGGYVIAEASPLLGSAPLSARDLAMVVHAFAEVGLLSQNPSLHSTFELGFLSAGLVRDLEARDLKTVLVSYARAASEGASREGVSVQPSAQLLGAMAFHVRQRVPQFDAETLVLSLRALSFLGSKDSLLFARVVVQMPRAILSFRPADLVVLLNTFVAANVQSAALFDLATPFFMERCAYLSVDDALSALRAYENAGREDELLLSSLVARIRPAQDTNQVSSAKRREIARYCARHSLDRTTLE